MVLKNKIRHFYYNVRTRIKYITDRNYFSPNLKIMNSEQTIEWVLNGKSISRFGDGELSLILCDEAIGFQKKSDSLSKALERVLRKPDKNNLVCIPRTFIDRRDMVFRAEQFWLWYLYMYKEKVLKILNSDYEYGDSLVTRFYLDYKNKAKTTERIKKLRKIWDKKRILIIEGKKTRLGVTNDLLDNAKQINRLLVPNKNAFDKYDAILEKALKIARKYDILLLSIGPTATVLVDDLSRSGVQAVDIGHIDAEYEWYRNKAKKKVAIRGKEIIETKKEGVGGLTKKEEKAYKESVVGVIE